jgi:hypothetical protein
MQRHGTALAITAPDFPANERLMGWKRFGLICARAWIGQ